MRYHFFFSGGSLEAIFLASLALLPLTGVALLALPSFTLGASGTFPLATFGLLASALLELAEGFDLTGTGTAAFGGGLLFLGSDLAGTFGSGDFGSDFLGSGTFAFLTFTGASSLVGFSGTPFLVGSAGKRAASLAFSFRFAESLPRKSSYQGT